MGKSYWCVSFFVGYSYHMILVMISYSDQNHEHFRMLIISLVE